MTTTFDTSTPTATDYISNGDDKIREFKTAVAERLAVDHTFAASGTTYDAATNGEHAKVTFTAPISDPTTGVNKGALYTKDVSAKAELHFRDEDNNVIQLTSAGKAKVVCDESTIEFNSGTLRVKDDGITAGKIALTALDDSTINLDGSDKIQIKVPATGGDISLSFSPVVMMGRYTSNGSAKTITCTGLTIRKVEIIHSTGATNANGCVAYKDASTTVANANYGITIATDSFTVGAANVNTNVSGQTYVWMVTGVRA